MRRTNAQSVSLAVIPEEILLTTDTPPAPACDPRLYPLAEYDLLMEKQHSWCFGRVSQYSKSYCICARLNDKPADGGFICIRR
jgi:hypothetical protein